jgi:hypothetical protein
MNKQFDFNKMSGDVLSIALIAGGGVLVYYAITRVPTSNGSPLKPTTNAFASGKDWAMNRDNMDLSRGSIVTKSIGNIGTPKHYVPDRVGVLHELHFPDGNVPHCGCRKDKPMY